MFGITRVWERKAEAWRHALTTMDQLQQLVPSGFLVAEWEHARTKVLCSANHPVHVRLNRTSQQITVQFSALATDLSGAVIVASVQPVSTVPVVSDGAVPVD